MQIHCPRSVVKASLSALCVMSLAGCAGDDDSSATASDSGESSAAMEAVENEVESRMQMEDDGDDPDAMVESGSSEESYEAGGESEMDHEMDGTSGMPSGGVSPFHQQPTQVVARPADVMQWTSAQVLDAVEEKDSAVLQAIQAKAVGSQGDPEFAQLMTQVLQKSSGQEMGGSAGGSGFGLPGLGSLFGGGMPPATGGNGSKTPMKPIIAPGSLPPGGAFYRPQRIVPSAVYGVDSLEMMIGESVLAYVPQAVQGSRAAAQRLQGSGSVNEDSVTSSGAGAAMEDMGESEMEGMDYQNDAGMGFESGQPRASGNLQDEALVRTVARALVTNNTAGAWATLKGIVNGDIASPLPQPLSTEIVLAEVFSAAAPNPAVAAEILTTATQSVVSDPIGNQSTFQFLAALAQRPTDHFLMLAKTSPPAVTDAGGMSPVGMDGMDGMDVPGQPSKVMMGVDPVDGHMPEGLGYEDGFGAPPGGPPSGALPPVRVSEAGMAIVANILWSKSSIMAVTGQLQSADSPASVADALALASTIPSDAVRHATYNLFKKSYEQGATGLTGSGLFRNVARDPGLLMVLKGLPRSRARKPASTGVNVPAIPASPADSWVAATQDVVLSLRDRLRNVADDPNLAFDGRQPVRLHQGAVAEKSIRIQVPGTLASELGESSPSATTMYYSMCRVTPQRDSEMQKIVDYYETRSKGIKREVRSLGILWYDGVKGNEDGTRTTMDVVIQQAGFESQRPGANENYEGGGGGPGGGGPVQFTVEVIVVVARDPRTVPSEDAVSSR